MSNCPEGIYPRTYSMYEYIHVHIFCKEQLRCLPRLWKLFVLFENVLWSLKKSQYIQYTRCTVISEGIKIQSEETQTAPLHDGVDKNGKTSMVWCSQWDCSQSGRVTQAIAGVVKSLKKMSISALNLLYNTTFIFYSFKPSNYSNYMFINFLPLIPESVGNGGVYHGQVTSFTQSWHVDTHAHSHSQPWAIYGNQLT